MGVCSAAGKANHKLHWKDRHFSSDANAGQDAGLVVGDCIAAQEVQTNLDDHYKDKPAKQPAMTNKLLGQVQPR